MNTNNSTKLSYDLFIRKIKEEVRKRMGNGYIIDINRVTKNNAVELDGLVILKNGERITTNIYLGDYYKNYRSGMSIGNILDEIIQIYKETTKEDKARSLCISYEFNEMKDHIVFRLVNYNMK